MCLTVLVHLDINYIIYSTQGAPGNDSSRCFAQLEAVWFSGTFIWELCVLNFLTLQTVGKP